MTTTTLTTIRGIAKDIIRDANVLGNKDASLCHDLLNTVDNIISTIDCYPALPHALDSNRFIAEVYRAQDDASLVNNSLWILDIIRHCRSSRYYNDVRPTLTSIAKATRKIIKLAK